jgi:isopentenyldiphosphate isomerase
MPSPHEIIDIVQLPDLLPTGETKPIMQAIEDGDWLSVFAIWLYRKTPEPAILFQGRSLKATVSPGKLDISAAGHYNAGETELDGLRELREELGLDLDRADCHAFGRHVNTYLDTAGRERRAVLSTYVCEFTGTDDLLKLEKNEVETVFWVPLRALLAMYRSEIPSIDIEGFDYEGRPLTRTVTLADFFYNIDDYHFRNAERLYLYLSEGWL